MSEDLISIIVPVYNIEGYLPKCLETIEAQTYRNLEIILVDDGSTDHSGDICDEFARKDKRVIVVHQNNLGLWAARNAGQRIAQGRFLMFIDGDDYIHLDTVKTLHQAISIDEKCDIAIVDRKKTHGFDEDISCVGEGEKEILTQEELVAKLFNGGICRNVWNKLYRHSLIKNIYANEFLRAQDYDFNIRVFMAANSAVFIHRIMYFWVQRPTSFTYQPNYWDLVYRCFAKMLFDNYVNLPDNQIKYGHFLLRDLYKNMVFWKNRNFRTSTEHEVFALCDYYERTTRKAYWCNLKINPFEKVVVVILLHCPRLTRRLMVMTKNY